jgi:hypothetical protein
MVFIKHSQINYVIISFLHILRKTGKDTDKRGNIIFLTYHLILFVVMLYAIILSRPIQNYKYTATAATSVNRKINDKKLYDVSILSLGSH